MFIHTKPRYSINELVSLLSVGRAKLYEEIQLERLKTYKLGKRRFASPEALDSYVKQCEKEAQA